MWARLTVVLCLISAGGTGAAEAIREDLDFTGRSKGRPVDLKGELLLPEGPGPFPAMVIVHGSAGPSNSREYVYAQELVEMGVAAFVGEHFAGRGVRSTVEDQGAVPGIEVLEDAYVILGKLAAHPRLDRRRIGIMGFSKGGTVALDAALLRFAERFAKGGPRFALHVAFYPACPNFYRDLRSDGAPIRLLIGGADTYAGVKPCTDLASAMKRAGARVETVIYPDAMHGFDTAKPFDNPKGENWSRCVFEEQADGSWVERTSASRTNDERGARIADGYANALKSCRTVGVRGGPNPAARAQAMADLKAAIQEAFQIR